MLGFDAGRREPCDWFLLARVGMAVAKAPPPLVQRALPGLNHLSIGSTPQTSPTPQTSTIEKTNIKHVALLNSFCSEQSYEFSGPGSTVAIRGALPVPPLWACVSAAPVGCRKTPVLTPFVGLSQGFLITCSNRKLRPEGDHRQSGESPKEGAGIAGRYRWKTPVEVSHSGAGQPPADGVADEGGRLMDV
jgi:hypothetical protein